ncbi:MAG: tetratricopeptide repeat protein [Pirellulales bacterium]
MTFALMMTLALMAADETPATSAAAVKAPVAQFVDIPALVDQAERSYLVQRWDRAIEGFQQATEANPTVGYLWWRLGTCQLMAGKYEDAIPSLTKARELGVYQWRPLRMAYRGEIAWGIAAAHARLGRNDEAVKWTRVSLDEGLRDIRKFHERHFDELLKDDAFRKLVWADRGQKLDRDEGFRHDLRYMLHEAKRIHYAPFRITSEEEFDSLAAQLESDIPRLSDDEILVRFKQILVRLGDGHTNIRPSDPPGWLGVMFFEFPEGVYIDAAITEHADLVGAKVLKIGNRSIDESLELARGITSRDNEQNVKMIAPHLLESKTLLSGLGIHQGDGPVPLVIEDAAGKQRNVELSFVKGQVPTKNIARSVPGCDKPLPKYWEARHKMYWFESRPDEGLVYCQINGIGNDSAEPFAKFCGRLFEAVEQPGIDGLVIDLRHNGGGDTFTNVPLLEGIIRCDKLQEPGKLFLIIGRRTFSAAQNTTSDLERRTKAILVGEPTGSNPNFIGESIAIPLPHSGWVMSLSDLWWQHSMAMDYRVWTHPQLYAPPTAAALREHRDVAMEAIGAYRAKKAVGGRP